MSKASLELGGGNWAAKDGNLLGYAVGDTSGKYLPREFDFTRGGDIAATRVNEDGLIEKYRENLFLHSNQFSETWSDDGGTIEGDFEGYDGTNNAWKYTKAGQYDGISQSSLSITGVHTISIYAKLPDGETDVDSVLFRVEYSGGNTNVVFSLTDNVVPAGANGITADKINVGNGWYRCVFTLNQSTTLVSFRPSLGSSTIGTSGSIYIQDAQLEQGLVATDYLESDDETGKAGVLENLPRIDYTGGSASLLLEPQRKNELAHSEYGGGYEVVDSNLTVTDNAEVSPEGLKNAVKIEGISTSSANQAVKFGALESGSVVGRTFTGSLYIKPVNSGDVGGNVYLSIQRRFGDFEASTEAIEIDSADWKRYEITYTFTGAGSGNQIGCDFKILKSGTPIDDIYVYGVQLEEGSYSTSYIPTYGVSVTREEDNMDTTFSSPLSTDGGVSVLYYIKGTDKKSGISANARYLNFATDSGLTTPYIAYNRTDEEHRVRVYDGTVSTYSKAEVDIENDVKIVVVAEGDTHKVFSNGVLRYTRTTNSIDWSSITDFVHTSDDDIGVIDVKQALLFPTALTDSECIALTTL
jgi:hypothetical protein